MLARAARHQGEHFLAVRGQAEPVSPPVVVHALALHQPAPPASRFAVAAGEDNTPAPAATDPLMAELLRCRSLPAGTDDAACREAWEVNRRRFMGETRTYIPPATANDTGER